MNKIEKFIYENWENTVRTCLKDEGTLIALPKPFTIPTIKDAFQEMYYWDTYFANVGLIISGLTEQAKNNTENVAYMIEKYGYMPNGNRTYYLSRSQPPFFTQMAREVYEQTGDKAWLKKMYDTGCKEHSFWQTERITACGLNRYYATISEKEIDGHSAYFTDRINIAPAKTTEEKRLMAEACLTFCESGWDCNSRFGLFPQNFAWLDLNSLHYGMENNLAYFAKELGIDSDWSQKAEERKALINKLCWNETVGGFCDYDFVNKKTSDFISCAAFYPLFTGLATKEQAEKTVKLLDRLEVAHGVAACEKREDLLNLQWDYPNGWACLHHIVISALKRYGFDDDAKRIAEKYCTLVERNFELTGNIWEKYNVVEGTVATTTDGGLAVLMMGWSAGVYLFCRQELA